MKQLLEKYNFDVEKDSIWLQLTPSVVAKSNFLYVQETGFFKCLSDYYTERKNLDSYLILLTLSGSGILKYDNETYSLTPGKAFFIDCIEHNYYKTTSNTNWETCWVHFKGANAENYYTLYKSNCPAVVSISEPLKFQKTIFDIIENNHSFKPGAELNNSLLLVELLTQLLSNSPSSLAPVSKIPENIQNVATYIDKNFLDSFSLEHLSNMFAISKYHLSREFKKYYGISINEYHIKLRIELSKKLLTSSSLTINEISEKTGIENANHFINLFKSRVHDTPHSYRKKWKHLE